MWPAPIVIMLRNVDPATLVYLLAFLGLFFWLYLRQGHGLLKLLRQAGTWVFLFVLVTLGYGIWNDLWVRIPPTASVSIAEGTVHIPRRRDGHFYLQMDIDDQSIEFLVDTGATSVMLSRSDAKRIGISTENLAYLETFTTANGEIRAAPVRLGDVSVQGIAFGPVRAWVSEGEMDISLLGQSFLLRFDRIEITQDEMILRM